MKSEHTYVAVGLGEVLFDHDVTDDTYTFGGAPANFADHFRKCMRIVPERRTCEVHVVSAIGADATGIPDRTGRKVEAELRKRRLAADIQIIADSETGLVDKEKDADGVNRYTILPAAWDRIAWTHELQRLAAVTDLVCFGSLAQRDPVSRATIQQFLATMPAQSVRVFDVNIRQEFYSREVLLDSIAQCTILKISDEEIGKVQQCLPEFAAKDHESFCRGLLEHYPAMQLVILTEGGAGSRIFTREQISGYLIPTQKREKPVDTVGAGDSFTAAFCAMLATGSDLWQAQWFASQVAAFVCTQVSATPAYPRDAKQQFLLPRRK